jgi:hypothetical protein
MSRRKLIGFTRPEDFRSVNIAQINIDMFLATPRLSLYCLDFANKEVLFVQTPAEIDLSEHVFYYVAQYAHAVKLYRMPIALFVNCKLPGHHTNLIFLHSVGRCGSTLLGKALALNKDVVLLSEPDIFSQLVNLRLANKVSDKTLRQWANAAVHWLNWCHVSNNVVIKFRSHCIEIADLLAACFPHAKNVFLYRNAHAVCESFAQGYWAKGLYGFIFFSVQRYRIARFLFRALLRPIKAAQGNYSPLLHRYPSEQFPYTGVNAIPLLMWLSVMERYQALYNAGISFVALRYEEMMANPYDIISSLLKLCGLPSGAQNKLDELLASDAQEGSFLSRNTRRGHMFSKNDFNEMDFILSKNNIIPTADHRVPGDFTDMIPDKKGAVHA